MKNRTLTFGAASLLAVLFTTSAHAAGDGPEIALTVSVRDTAGCGPSAQLNLSTAGVREVAAAALRSKGYTVVSDYRKVAMGLEAVVQVSYCRNVSGGNIIGYSAVVGMYGMSDGKAVASPGLTRVPFNWGNDFISFGGDASHGQEAKIRTGVRNAIEGWVAQTF